MTYNSPAILVRKEYVSRGDANQYDLNPVIIAPHYGLHGFFDDFEELGEYDNADGNNFSDWPGKTAESVLDTSSASVLITGVLEYDDFNLPGEAGASGRIGLVTTDGNRIRSESRIFKSGNGYDRSSVYGSRNVSIGDYIQVKKNDDVREAQVMGIIPEEIDSNIAATVADLLSASQAASNSVTENIDSTDLSVTADESGYDGLADGVLTEVYACEVVETDGTLENTFVNITSQSGKDDVTRKQLAASGAAVECGTRGATFTVTDAGGGSFIVGDSWEVSISQQFDGTTGRHTPVSGGTYSGTDNIKYIVRVVTGGVIGTDEIILKISTDNGKDVSSQQVVASAGDILIGSYGVTMEMLSGEALVGGNVFSVQATAASEGAYRTLVLSQNMTGFSDSDSLDIKLGVNVENVYINRAYWTASESQITVAAAAKCSTELFGTEKILEIISGTLYIKYKELLQEYAGTLGAVNDISDIADVMGFIHPANPMALLVYAALTECNGKTVYFTALSTNNDAGYTEAYEFLLDKQNIYSLVPYENSESLRNMAIAHLSAANAPEKAYFRKAYLGAYTDRTYAFYKEESDSMLEATLSGTTLTCSEALFVTNSVRAGDKVRIGYGTEPDGTVTYSEYTVDSVTNETTLEITETASEDEPVATRMEIWRTCTNSEYAARLASEAEGVTNKAISTVWGTTKPRIAAVSDEELPQSVLAAASAGKRCASAPHQPLTEEAYAVVTVEDSSMTDAQKEAIASNGIWIVRKDNSGATIVHHQLTMDMTNETTREDSVVCNVDQLCLEYRDSVKDLKGKANAIDNILRLIRTRLAARTEAIQARAYSELIGMQVENLVIEKLYYDRALRDVLIFQGYFEGLPGPINRIDMTFRIL